jgi:trans-2,3-dihydro-3-hydroxyanthranilate isomerase
MDIPFRLVDVFCERPLEGNQLCVVPEPLDLDDATMQAVAKEIGFSETTFVQDYGEDRYSMRIFTPGHELPFAGHPTLGTAFVMVAEGRVTSPLAQLVRAGEIPVEIDVATGSGRMWQLPPVFGPEFEDRELVAAAAGLTVEDLRADLPVQVVSTGLPPLIVPVRDLQTLRGATRNGKLVGEAVKRGGAEEFYLFAVTDDGVTARMFDREFGVGEDPATGSAAGPLGAYLAHHGLAGMPGIVGIRQGEQVGRPSLIEVEVQPEGGSWRVIVGGHVRIVGEGRFRF